ncbi:MAG: PadR family transcriptional regulator [Planctomycetota bacterium]|jgi:DNA-binding PadR family transcriptional regulator
MKFERELLKGVAPVVVLEILSRGKMYGYELSEALEQRSEGILSLGRGTLYPRKRRYYSITSKGKGELAAKKEQWASLQQGVNLVFGLGGLTLA